MSFPGTYNINYYYGDTLEFRVFPKNSSGEPFDLSTFTNPRFTIALNRNTPVEDHIVCFAQIDPDNTSVLCAIRPSDAERINPDASYVYDVEISKTSNPYDIVYTVLTGSVSVTRDVTKADSGTVTVEIPENPTSLTLDSFTNSSLTVSWTAPTSGDFPTNYKLAILPFTESIVDIRQAIQDSNLSISATNTSYTFPGLDASTDYSVAVRSSNSAGDADIETIAFNTTPFTTDDPDPTAPAAPTITSLAPIDEGFQVSFTAGADGGSSITNYKYSVDGSTYTAFDPSQTTSPLTITGLTNGTLYPVTIRAVNAIGDSVSSNTLAGTPEAEITPDFVVTNDGSTSYLIDGVANDTITLVRGQTYIFEVNTTGHPFWIQIPPPPYDDGQVYVTGIDNPGIENGLMTWVVDESAPNTLYYVCEFHQSMGGTINIIDGES